MSPITELIKNYIFEALEQLDLPKVEIGLEHPADSAHGDYSANVAMVLYSQVKNQYASPRELAQAIIDQLPVPSSQLPVTSIQLAGPGFINFYLSEDFFIDQLHTVNENQGKVIQATNTQAITVEFTDPNPFKEFHIGHLYSNVVGESVSRLFETVGADVRRVCYQGDVGMHVAKSVWGVMAILSDSNTPVADDVFDFALNKLNAKNKLTLNEKSQFLGKAYAHGATAYEEDEVAKAEIIALNKMIFSNDVRVKALYDLGKKWSLEYFEAIYRRLGTKFDGYYFESEVGKIGLEIVKHHIADGIFAESQGAVIFPGSKHGLHDRVFINSLGLPTYEAKELGLAPAKYQDKQYDRSIIITGNEINEYFKVLLKALSLISPELAVKTKHISHGMVRLPEGKMSSRTGKVLTGEWLLSEVSTRVSTIALSSGRTSQTETGKLTSILSDVEQDEITEKVTIAATKYALLKNNIGGNISFDLDETVSFEGNSGPYLLYTYARSRSVLVKASELQSLRASKQLEIKNFKFEIEEYAILRLLYQFDEVVQKAVKEYSPHFICTYLYQLAQSYNSLYNRLSILSADSEDQMMLRLQLTEAVGYILKEGLWLLGIETVEKM